MSRSLLFAGLVLLFVGCASGGSEDDAGVSPPITDGGRDDGGGSDDGGPPGPSDAGPRDAGPQDAGPSCATAGCDPLATCDASSGAPVCTCPDGYQGDGTSCADVDECATGAAGCDPNATCTNTEGGFTCACAMGFEGDGTSCTDVDECATGMATCDTNATCANEPGGFSCACDAGFMGDGFSCVDINECATGAAGCHTFASCENSAGSFSCTCIAGYTGDGFSCADVNECATGAAGCDANASCTNTPGSFSCRCNPGWTGSGTSCSDVNECASGLDDCSANATCTNTPGSWSCACNPGFTGDGRTCTPIGPTCTLIDGFEGMGTTWPRSPWVVESTGGTIVTTPVRDGSYALQNPDWHYRTDVSVGAIGDRLEAWVHSASGTGRVYLGFDANASGARSAVFAPNTSELIIQQNSSYGYANEATTAATFSASTWYRLEAEFLSGNQVRVRVYTAGGSVVATTTHTFTSSNVGGVAIRTFNDLVVDTIRVCR
ncbi:MAG: calcium-binding EGF-like domain-containing protein [Myxococcota bacterium]|nr:calcium-binding EGF-like domain-containing protein [Myxococcota bacterium]